MRAMSAFAGIGGFEVGFARAGITVTDSIEWDTWCQRVLAQHFPTTTIHGDINGVAAQDLAPALDAFVGGFPCQDTSIAAPNRAGLAGKRSGEFFTFADLTESYLQLTADARPTWVAIENPPGLLKSNGRRDFATVRQRLRDLGYRNAWRVVDGGRLGTVQRRERILLVGHLGDPIAAGAVLGLIDASGRPVAPGAVRAIPQGRSVAAGSTHVYRKSARPRAALSAGGYETWVEDGRANTLTGFDGGLATRQTHLVVQDGRPRTLTLREWERLQGFEDDWTALAPASQRFKQLGNAIHTGTSEWLGRGFMHVHTQITLTGSPV